MKYCPLMIQRIFLLYFQLYLYKKCKSCVLRSPRQSFEGHPLGLYFSAETYNLSHASSYIYNICLLHVGAAYIIYAHYLHVQIYCLGEEELEKRNMRLG